MNRREFLKSLAVACAASSQVPNLGAVDTTSAQLNLKLPRRLLGKTGVMVSALALGGVIGMQLPPSPEHDPVAIADAALDLGITYFDTSPDYNNGQSETNYGEVMARRRKEVFLATKTNDRNYDGTLRSIEQSLKRLRTDHVDLLQIHGVSAKDDPASWGKPDGVLTALHKLRDQKVIRFIGLTGHDSAARLREAIEMHEFDTLLTTLNPVPRRQPFREDLLPVANRKQMGVIAMKVMGGGNGCLATGNPLQKVLRPYHDQTPHQVTPPLLLRYTLALPVSVAVVGVASVDQLKANISVVREAMPMGLTERQDLERLMA
ncbi:MAG TPA: aldo/keto reductase [Candidatus Acidoferrum sp.]|jgi:aryl-alcohol dehydrogenase-like predicted oxidoreductase|nr:aldo/keto reductase [Candidatus Acidoferrum sp.]